MSAIQQLLTDHIDIWTAAETEKKSGRGRASGSAASVYGIKKLRELILELAVRGKLVPQDSSDEPASELIKRIQIERSKLVAEGKIKKDKLLGAISGTEKPFNLPLGWEWSTLSAVSLVNPRNSVEDDLLVSFVTMTMIEAKFNSHHDQEHRLWKEIKQGFTHFAEGDIGVAKITPCFENSKACVFSGLLNKIGAGTTELHVVRPINSTLAPRYVLAYLKSPQFLVNGERRMTGTAGQKRLPKEFLESNPFPLPPLAEQHRIVAKVDELMALCDQLETQHSNAADAHEQLVSHLLGTLTQSQSAADFNANWQRIATHFDTLFITEASINALKRTLLQLAVMGKLVAQDSRDESGLELSYRIQRSRIAKRKIVTLSEEIDPLREDFLPNSWSWTSIDQISADDPSAITDGPFGANLKTEHYVDQPGYRVIRLQNIGHGEFRNEYQSYIDEARFEKLAKHQVRGGDLIVAGLIDTSIRCCAAPNDIGHAIVKADCYRLSVHPFVFPSYVLHYLNSVTAHEFAAVHHHGLTLTRIGLGNFRSIPIPLPPFAEQHRIVAKVDELMGLCDQVRSRITAASQQQKKLADVLVEHAVIGEMAL